MQSTQYITTPIHYYTELFEVTEQNIHPHSCLYQLSQRYLEKATALLVLGSSRKTPMLLFTSLWNMQYIFRHGTFPKRPLGKFHWCKTPEAVIQTTASPGQSKDAFLLVFLFLHTYKRENLEGLTWKKIEYFWTNLPTSSWGSLFSSSENSWEKGNRNRFPLTYTSNLTSYVVHLFRNLHLTSETKEYQLKMKSILLDNRAMFVTWKVKA